MLRFHCYANSDAHYKLRVRGRGTNLFAEKKKKALARLAEKKLHGEEKKKQVPGEEEAVPGEKKLCSGTGEKKNLLSSRAVPEMICVFYNFILKGKMVLSINCWVHQQYCWVHLATPNPHS